MKKQERRSPSAAPPRAYHKPGAFNERATNAFHGRIIAPCSRASENARPPRSSSAPFSRAPAPPIRPSRATSRSGAWSERRRRLDTGGGREAAGPSAWHRGAGGVWAFGALDRARHGALGDGPGVVVFGARLAPSARLQPRSGARARDRRRADAPLQPVRWNLAGGIRERRDGLAGAPDAGASGGGRRRLRADARGGGDAGSRPPPGVSPDTDRERAAPFGAVRGRARGADHARADHAPAGERVSPRWRSSIEVCQLNCHRLAKKFYDSRAPGLGTPLADLRFRSSAAPLRRTRGQTKTPFEPQGGRAPRT